MANEELIDHHNLVEIKSCHYESAAKRIGTAGLTVGRVPGRTLDEDLIAVCFDKDEIEKELNDFEQVFGDHYETIAWNDCCFEGLDNDISGKYDYFHRRDLTLLKTKEQIYADKQSNNSPTTN